MHRKPVFPAFAAALAALATGCEWTGTSSSDSWSGSYDAMNFSGSYRSAATLESGSASSSDETGSNASAVKETVGSYSAGTYRYSGSLSHTPVVLSSVQIQLCGISFTSDSSGNLTSSYGTGKVTTAGAWSGDVTGTTTTSGATTRESNQKCGDIHGSSFSGKAPRENLVAGTVTVTVHDTSAGSNAVTTFADIGKDGILVPTVSGSGASGTVNYSTGAILLQLTSDPIGYVSATYEYNSSSASASSVLKDSGSIVAVYQYTDGSSSSSASMSVATSSSDITAITVSQSGQNLSMSTNTGIVMSGKFTAVRETKVASDSGTATYNAQFQVTSAAGHKFVGTLNYDASSGHRTLNGTLTQGKAVYDVQGVGPAF